MITAALIYCAAMALLGPMMIRCRDDVLAKGRTAPPEWVLIVAGPVVVALCPRETLGLRPRV